MTDTEVQTIKISIFLANKLFTTLEAPIENHSGDYYMPILMLIKNSFEIDPMLMRRDFFRKRR